MNVMLSMLAQAAAAGRGRGSADVVVGLAQDDHPHRMAQAAQFGRLVYLH